MKALAFFALALGSLSATAQEATPPSAALVVVTLEEVDAMALEQLRGSLAKDHRLLSQPDLRRVLEQPAPERTREEEVRLELVVASERIRRFDLPHVAEALRRARDLSRELAPTPAARELMIELCLREASLAHLQGNQASVRRSMRFALSLAPALELDPAAYPPEMREAAASARIERAAAPQVHLQLKTQPPGARAFLGSALVGMTPLEVETSEGPTVLWLQEANSAPRIEWIDAAKDGQVDIELQPVPKEAALEPLIAAIRRAAGNERETSIRALMATLDVDSIFLLENLGQAPVRIDRVARLRPELLTQVELSPPPSSAWPAWSASAAAAVLAGVGIGFAIDARRNEGLARDAHFADDGAAFHDAARGSALAANLFYGAAGAAALGALALFTLN